MPFSWIIVSHLTKDQLSLGNSDFFKNNLSTHCCHLNFLQSRFPALMARLALFEIHFNIELAVHFPNSLQILLVFPNPRTQACHKGRT